MITIGQIKTKFLCFSFAALALSCQAQNNTVMAPNEFEASIANDSVQVLDVRTAGEYNSGHIKKALWANWNDAKEFERRTSFLDKKKPVYVYCLAGGRSAAAAKKLKEKGFKVFDLQGGINAWKSNQKPLEGKTNAPQMTTAQYTTATAKVGMVLVDFGATWCPPCKIMEPVLEKLVKDNGNKFSFFKVDAGNDENVVQANNVVELPVFIVYKDGKEVWRKTGICTEEELKKALGL